MRNDLYWTIKQLPEVKHLTPEQWASLTERVDLADIYWSLGRRSCLLAGIAGIIGWSVFASTSVQIAAVAAAIAFTGTAVFIWRLLLLRIRAALRLTLKQQLRGQRLPVCLDCGYDVRGGESDRCPECGALVVPPTN